ncbi:hypothetical protein L484_020393 [Morus notabilis]|uniref:Uncharacterized protein n=1 Tax=Morus notabilis TaxID=981085 RepID=W9RNA9_9ROSA|nr:hypothetical protein L484_020393 [Morus notabilis]
MVDRKTTLTGFLREIEITRYYSWSVGSGWSSDATSGHDAGLLAESWSPNSSRRWLSREGGCVWCSVSVGVDLTRLGGGLLVAWTVVSNVFGSEWPRSHGAFPSSPPVVLFLYGGSAQIWLSHFGKRLSIDGFLLLFSCHNRWCVLRMVLCLPPA